MSLTDALLLEGYRDPREVWIALRSDGQRGSGTIDDPYDGNTKNFTAYAISSLTKGGSGNLVATAVTTSNHPFLPGDMVTIVGVGTGQTLDRYYSGTFQVTSVTNNSFIYQMRGEPTSSQAPGTITCVREREQFDTVMRAMPANCAIHLGPGVFESKGIAPEIANYELKNGQRILGSGRAVTTLKLVGAGWPELAYFLIAPHVYYAYLEDIEVSDLTFDCNIAGQPEALVSCAALAIVGRHIRLRRLRAINFASQTTSYVENFVFAAGAPHPDAGLEGVHCVIEDCIAEQPGLNAGNNSSVFILSSGERPNDGIMFYHRAFGIRNCWYDGTLTDRSVPISGITISAGVATVTTRVPHLRNNNDWVVIAGAVENGSTQSAYNGTYQISNVSTDQFTYSPVAYLGRDGALSVPTTNPTGDMWVDRFSSHRIPVQKLERDTSDSTIAILTSHGPHFRKPSQWVRVLSVTSPTPAGTEAYYGRFPIINGGITSPGVLKYRMNSAPAKLIVQDTTCPGGSTTCQQDVVFLGVSNIGFSTDGGSEAVAEGNRVFNTGFGGSYHDTWGTKDQTDRNNYYSDVLTGPYEVMGRSSDLKLGSLSVAGATATFTTPDTEQPHGLVVGQAVRINPFLGTPPQEYFVVTAVPTASSFEFQVSGSVTPAPPYSFGALWQVGLAIRQNNIVELGQGHHVGLGPNYGYGYSSGLPFYSGPHDAQYVFRRVIAKENLIGLTPNSLNPLARGIQLGNVEQAVVENNLLTLLWQLPIDVSVSQPLHFFNNQNSSGTLIQPASGKTGDDLRIRIADALTLAL